MVPLKGWDIVVDYAFTKMDILDDTHRVSLSVGIK
jgi:hypothetical protein